MSDSKIERLRVSAFIICMNEERHIADCIRSLDFCDEILVIDSLSKDRTVELARAAAPQVRVIERPWPGYKNQKAFGLAQVANEWVINLDADERISPTLRSEILTVLEREARQETPVVGYEINRLVWYLGRWWRRGGWYPEYRLRLFRKSRVTWGGVDPHEKPILRGGAGRLNGDIYHFTYDNLEDQLNRLQHFSSLAAEQMDSAGVQPSLTSLLVNPWLRSFKFFFLKRGYREGIAGLIVAVCEGYYTFLKYAKLWERHFNRKSDSGRPS